MKDKELRREIDDRFKDVGIRHDALAALVKLLEDMLLNEDAPGKWVFLPDAVPLA